MFRLGKAALSAAVISLCACTSALAQGAFPSRNITMVVPFAPGGGTDVLARMMAKEVETALGKSVVVENRPGAGGTIGAMAVLRAPPDGHTIFLGSGTNLAVNVSLYKKLSYDPVKQFTPLALAAATPFVLVVNPSVPAKTVREFIDYVKPRQKDLNYASSGPGVPHHLFMELMGSMAGFKIQMVPYKGSLPALNDVVAGHVPMMFVDIGPALGSINAGKVRALAVSTAKRVDLVKDVPALAETLPGFDAAGWFMFAGPAAMPQEAAVKLHAAMDAALAKPAFGAALVKFGLIPQKNMPVADLKAFMAAEIERWRKVVRLAGVEGRF
ncbi:MAG: Bug family tripartite tricarboxylate transporter substrate binding protein [Beijerinckiaceae bacterium]